MNWTWRKIAVLALASIVVIAILGAAIDKLVLPFVVSITDTVHVPSVVGRDRTSAEILLRDAGLVVMEPRVQFSATVAAGTVMSQLPYAGATVKEGRRIYITVSKGVETLSMPSLYGATMRDARLTLMRLGLQIGEMSYDTSGSVLAGRVLRQSVPTGSAIASGTLVNLVISRGTTMVRVPLLVSLSLDEAEQLLRDVGLVPGAMTTITSSAFQAGTIMHQDPPADSLVVVGSTVTFVTAK